MSTPVHWNEQAMPLGIGLDQLLYQVRRTDDGLLFDSVTMAELTDGEQLIALDALVTPYAKLERKVRQLQQVMARAVQGLSVEAAQVSDPFKQNGIANVVALFELSDGQTVSVYFHNPDATPGKILPTDELISWKWLLNKKDITIVVAPERGSDLAIREVGRRIMKLAAKNSAAFARVNARRAERLQNIASLRGEVEGLERELDGLTREIEVARLEAEERNLKAVEDGQQNSVEKGVAALNSIRQFLSRGQFKAIADAMKGEEGRFFIDKAKVLAQLIEGMAKTYEQDGKGDDATAYLHYFKGSGDWYITEKDASGKGTEQAFGLADLGQGGELGYISIDELVRNNVELDLHFDPKSLAALKKVEPLPAAKRAISPSLAEATESLRSAISDAEFRGVFIKADGDPSQAVAASILKSAKTFLLYAEALARKGSSLSPTGSLWINADKAFDRASRNANWNEVAKAHAPAAVAQILSASTPAEAAALQADFLALFLRAITLPVTAETNKTDAGLPGGGEQAVDPQMLMPEGKANTVKTAKGTKVETGFTVIEADRLIASHDINGNLNPEYPQIIQPRDRGRDSSIAWVKKTASQLDPDSLGRTSRADSGAPIIGPDRVVESGNGRTMAIQEAYRAGTADEYREWLIDEAAYFGLDAERIRAMKAPVLVRVRTSSVDRREFAVEANQDDKLTMTGTEKAKADADRLDTALLAKLSDEGNLLAASNRDFVNGFLQSLGDTEAAQYMTTNGQPTGALIARIQAAIFAKAYNDDRLLELTADSSRPEVANVLEALNVSAPEFILAQAADAAGTQALTGQLADSVQTSLNQQAVEAIIQATNLVRKARSEGGSVEEAINQLGLFGDIPPATAAMALFISKNNRSAKRLGVAFKAMAEFVRQEAERGQTVDMFGESQAASLQQILEAANRKLDQEYGEGAFAIESLDLFSMPEPEPAAEPMNYAAWREALVAQVQERLSVSSDEAYKIVSMQSSLVAGFGTRADQVPERTPSEVAVEMIEKLTAFPDAPADWSLERSTERGYALYKHSGGDIEIDLKAVGVVAGPVDFYTYKIIKGGAFHSQGRIAGEETPRDAQSMESVFAEAEALAGAAEPSGPATEADVERARAETDTYPTEEQKESGDYQKGELSLFGLEIAIENPQGSTRSGKTKDGAEWSNTMPTDYGFIRGTLGADGDEVDVFVGPDLQSETAFVITQVGKDGEFDEYKTLLGFTGEADARSAYLSSYGPGWDGLGNIRAMSIDEFKAWLGSEAPRTAPAPVEALQETEMQPVQPTPESVAQSDDRSFLESILNNTVADILAPELGDQIGAVYERNAEDAEMLSLIEQAVMAYQRAMEQATASL